MPEATLKLILIDAAVSVLFLSLFSRLLGNILKYYRPTGRKTPTVVLWIIISATLWWVLTSLISGNISAADTAYRQMIFNTFPLRFSLALMVLGCVTLISWIKGQSDDSEKINKRLSEIRELTKQAELHNLRQQLQPHFLFNSLNSIHALINQDPQKSREMLLNLSEFLRGTLKKENHSMHTLEQELRQTRLYLGIEQVRFGDRLNVSFHAEEPLPDFQVPALMLQPVVENAVKHGIYQTEGNVHIQIICTVSPSYCEFTVTNPCDPKNTKRSKPTGAGFGLSSLQRRFFLLYGRNDLIATGINEHTFITRIKIPRQ